MALPAEGELNRLALDPGRAREYNAPERFIPMGLSLQRTRTPRPLIELMIEPLEEVSVADIKHVAEVNRKSKVQPLKRLSARHRLMAYMVADGRQPAVIAAELGISLANVSIVQADPSFRNLVENISNDKHGEYLDFHSKLAAVGEDALDELQRRLDGEPEMFGAGFLSDLTMKIADRTGHGPTSTQKTEVNVTVGIAERMAAARKASSEAKVIEGEATEGGKGITPTNRLARGGRPAQEMKSVGPVLPAGEQPVPTPADIIDAIDEQLTNSAERL